MVNWLRRRRGGKSRPAPVPVQEHRKGVRPAEFSSDVAVPLTQAAVTGALLAGIITYLIHLLFPSYRLILDTWLGLTLGCTTLAWLVLLGESRRLLWTIESWLDKDLDRDGFKGNPQKRLLSIMVQEGKRHRLIDSAWLGLDDANLIMFCKGLAKTGDLTEGRWSRDKAFPDGINQYRRVRAKLAEVGMIAPKYPGRTNSTYTLTASGRAMVRSVVEEADSN